MSSDHVLLACHFVCYPPKGWLCALSSSIYIGDEDHPAAVQCEEASVHRADPQRPECLRAGHQERADSAQAEGWEPAPF